MEEHARARSEKTESSIAQLKTRFRQGVFGGLIPEIQRAIAAENYVTPTPIQKQCIPHLLQGKDLIGSAQTGTGKTAAFTLPLLQMIAKNPKRLKKGTPRVLILAPTRELAAQIRDSIRTYSRFLRISHTVIFGGVKQYSQTKALNRGVDIIVATPGRLLDLIRQGFIHLNEVEVFILDEGDRMLDMGFIPDIKQVLSFIPEKRQTMFFSATMPKKIVKLAHTMVHDHVRVSISPEKPAVESIDQKVLFVDKKNKDALLVSLMNELQINKALIFTQMKHVANKVMKKLDRAGIYGAAIHGNKSQFARTKALSGFKKDRFRVLVATDVAARGLDVDNITHVINYDLPVEAETYVHRIGRTARAGAEGNAISFCCAEDRMYLREIEELLGNPVPADKKHPYHCERAFQSDSHAPKMGGRGGGRKKSAGKKTNNASANRNNSSDNVPAKNGSSRTNKSRSRSRSKNARSGSNSAMKGNSPGAKNSEAGTNSGRAQSKGRNTRSGGNSATKGNNGKQGKHSTNKYSLNFIKSNSAPKRNKKRAGGSRAGSSINNASANGGKKSYRHRSSNNNKQQSVFR